MSSTQIAEQWRFYAFGYGPRGVAIRLVDYLAGAGHGAAHRGVSYTEFVTTAPPSEVIAARRALGITQSPTIAALPVANRSDPQRYTEDEVYPWFDGEPVDEDD
jgi:hypothetical protein